MEQIVYLIPLLSITLGIGMIITVILTMHRAKIRELDQRHKERMAAIEKGLDPNPTQLPDERQASRPSLGELPARSPSRFLLRGLIWFCVGLAVALGGRGTFNDGLLTFAWIATAIGAAYLVYYAVEGRGAPSLTPRGSPPRESPSRESPLGEPASRLPAEPPARHDQPPPGA